MDHMDWDADDENVEGDEVEESMYFGRDGLIFLIDCSKSMFKEREPEEHPFKISLECCKTTMLNKIISSQRDMIGVILMGTSNTKNELNVSHLYTLQDLQQPSADKIKQLETMLKDNDFNNFSKEYGHSDDVSLSDALWLCQTAFSKSPVKLSSQRILLFTNNDNPHKNSPNKQHLSRTKAKDLGQTEIELELLHIGTSFNPDIFYKDLVQLAKGDDSDDWRLPNPANRIDELLARVCRKDHKKRSTGKVHFTLGEGVKLGVALYSLVRRTYAPKTTKLDRTTNEEVKSTVKKFDQNTGAVILPSEVNKYQMFAYKKIILTQDEIRNLRNITEPGLKLLGFKPAEKIKMHYHVRPSLFLYPEEGLVQGSKKLFAALLDRCLTRKVVPICCLARTISAPAIVALIPQEEVLDNSNVQLVPPGFHLVYLPYSEDIRQLNIESNIKANPEQVEKMKQIIRKLRFPYSPYRFDNPKLQTLWRNIEALALDHGEPEPVKDVTVPDYEYMKTKLGTLPQELMEEMYPMDYMPGGKPKATSGRKRTLDLQNEKPAKTAKPEDTTDENAMRELAEQGKVEKLKVKELSAFLTQEGYKVKSMKKVELVTKVYQHFGIPQPDV